MTRPSEQSRRGRGGWGRGGWPRGSRPPWWPETEAWPPQQRAWRAQRGRSTFWLPFVSLLVLFVLFAAGMVAVAALALAALVGLVQVPDAVIVAAVVALLLFGAVVGMLGRGLHRAGRPIDELIAAAERVEAGDYSERVTEAGPRPVRRLSRAFNTMSARLETTDQLRRSFLADVSHELRTPLTVIQGQLQAMADGVYPADYAHLAPVYEQARTLERLVDDLRTLALAEAGSLELTREPTDLAELTGELAAGFLAVAAARRITLSTDAEPRLPSVSVDRARIRQVLANLIDNALRYTPDGGAISLSVRREGDYLAVEVSNTGAGIPAELLPHVFERFTKGSDSPGNGLGLAIARDLVEAHGGAISAASVDGQGSTLRVLLPVAPPAG